MITIKEMIVNNDFDQITPDHAITFMDFQLLANCKLGDYSLYHIAKSGVTARDVGDLSSCKPKEQVAVNSFYEAAKLDFPTTVATLVQWVEKQNKEFELPEKFIDAVTTIKQATINSTNYPVSRQRHQENEILSAIKELGYEATALPKPRSGKAGVKAAVRAKLNFPVCVFNKAWERLRSDNSIQDATPTLPQFGVTGDACGGG